MLGEVLDLGVGGMKIAIEAGHNIKVGQTCNVAIGDGAGETYSLVGTVRWIEDTNYIMVFGISLDSADRIDA